MNEKEWKALGDPPQLAEILAKHNEDECTPNETAEGGYLEIWWVAQDRTWHTERPRNVMSQRASACWLLTLADWQTFAKRMELVAMYAAGLETFERGGRFFALQEVKRITFTLGWAYGLARMDNDLSWWETTVFRISERAPSPLLREQARQVLDAMRGL